jgi:hypothetical protein
MAEIVGQVLADNAFAFLGHRGFTLRCTLG